MTNDSLLSFTLPAVSRKKITAASDGGRDLPRVIHQATTSATIAYAKPMSLSSELEPR
ncbi:MAG: hypothetical protein FD153_1173 [Rhodospirillaceae bacterium]|nr:MAG: hypothetical protein FD153_1173 [Rhodospirillaceae bacterium]